MSSKLLYLKKTLKHIVRLPLPHFEHVPLPFKPLCEKTVPIMEPPSQVVSIILVTALLHVMIIMRVVVYYKTLQLIYNAWNTESWSFCLSCWNQCTVFPGPVQFCSLRINTAILWPRSVLIVADTGPLRHTQTGTI